MYFLFEEALNGITAKGISYLSLKNWDKLTHLSLGTCSLKKKRMVLVLLVASTFQGLQFPS